MISFKNAVCASEDRVCAETCDRDVPRVERVWMEPGSDVGKGLKERGWQRKKQAFSYCGI